MTGRTVWLASYPKSGNTWFRAVFSAWRRGDPFALDATDPIASLRNRLDDAFGLGASDLTDEEARALRPAADDVLDGDHSEPHLQKIHDALHAGADDGLIVSEAATRCAIYLVRDPRDVAVSYAHHSDRDVQWATEEICSPHTKIGPGADDIGVHFPQRIGDWSTHVSTWVDRAPFPVHVLRYEDCLTDPLTAFGGAFTFAGISVTPHELGAAIAAASFDRLQQQESENGFAERWGRSPFFRRGIVGAWRDELTSDLVARIERAHGPTMARFGYRAPAADVVTAPSKAVNAESARDQSRGRR